MIRAPTRSRPPSAGQLAVDVTPLLVVGNDDKRVGVILFNNGPAAVYVDFSPNVSTTGGLGIPSGAGISFDSPYALYAVAAATGSMVSFMEETR